MKTREYNGYLGSYLDDDDFYDIGMLGFFRSIKTLQGLEKTGHEYTTLSEENKDRLRRYHFSMGIKTAYHCDIHAQRAEQRKSMLFAKSLDAHISDTDEDEKEQYDFIPANDLPVYITAESSYSLDMLYKYLNKKQIMLCGMLIAGWTQTKLLEDKYATLRDICTIKLYLEQIIKYGKVLWYADEYKSDTPNVIYEITKNKWSVRHRYGGKQYMIEYYDNLNDALDLHSELEQYLNTGGDFASWYQDFRKQRNLKKIKK